MRFFRRLLFLALPLLLALAGCRRASPFLEPGPDGKPRVLIWHQKSGKERALFERLVGEYNAAHPDRRVEALYRENEEMRNLFVIAAVAGQGPDLVYGPSDNVGVYHVTRTVRPLDGLLRPGVREQFIPEAAVAYEGKTWILAEQIGNHLALIYDPVRVPTPPGPLDEQIALGKQLTRARSGEGKADEYGLTWNYREPYFFIPFLTAFGGWVMDDAGRPTLDNDRTAAALQFILDLRDKEKVIPREGDYEIADALFKEGRAAMIINGPWSWVAYGVPEKARLAPLPTNAQTGLPCTPIYSLCGYGVNVNVPDAKLPLVLEVLEHFTGSEVQTRFARELLIAPTRLDVRESAAVKESVALQASLAQIGRARPMPLRPEMRQIWDGMRGPYQLIMSGSVSARDGARKMQEECERLIRDAQR